MSKHGHGHRREDHREHRRHEHEPRAHTEATLNQRHILESFIGALSALLIVVLILAPLVGARRQRRG